MVIGDRLRELRLQKHLSQGDIEKRSGLLRCYLSRVENGHTVPTVETLEKIAAAMGLPLYRFFLDGNQAPDIPKLAKRASGNLELWGSDGKDREWFGRFRKALSRTNAKDQKLLLHLAQKMAHANRE